MSFPSGVEKGVTRESWEGARAPAEGLRAQTETRLCSQVHGVVRGGLGAHSAREPACTSQQQSSLVFLQGHSMFPHPILPGAAGSLCPGGSCPGLKKIPPEYQGSLRLAPPALLTSEAQLTVTNPTVLCRALLLLLAAAPAPLDTLIELSPAVPSCVLLQALLLGPSVLKPNLPHKHKAHIWRMPTPTPQPPGGWRQGLEFKAMSTLCPWLPLPEPQTSPIWQIPQDHGPEPQVPKRISDMVCIPPHAFPCRGHRLALGLPGVSLGPGSQGGK